MAGRKSAAELALQAQGLGLVHRGSLDPPEDLSEPEKSLFLETVASMPRAFFKQHDIPLLVGYVRAANACNRIAAQIAAYPIDTSVLKLAPFYDMLEKHTRSMSSAATRLRITPQTSYQAKKSRAGVTSGEVTKKPWEFEG